MFLVSIGDAALAKGSSWNRGADFLEGVFVVDTVYIAVSMTVFVSMPVSMSVVAKVRVRARLAYRSGVVSAMAGLMGLLARMSTTAAATAGSWITLKIVDIAMTRVWVNA